MKGRKVGTFLVHFFMIARGKVVMLSEDHYIGSYQPPVVSKVVVEATATYYVDFITQL